MASKQGNTRTIKQTPAKSAMVKAIHGGTPVKPNVVVIGGGGTAQGSALADRHYTEATRESANWRGFFAEILSLGAGEANKAYRASLNAKKRDTAAGDKATGVQTSRTAGVRLSECLTVAKAGDRGLTMDAIVSLWNEKKIGEPKNADTVGHALIVQTARRWNETHLVDGTEVEAGASHAKAGKAPLSATEKVKRYILSTYAITDFPKLAALMQSIAKRVKTPEDVKRELAKADPKAPKKERRAEARNVTPLVTPAAKPVDSTPRKVRRAAVAA